MFSASLYIIATPRITLTIHVTYCSLFTILITLIKIVFCREIFYCTPFFCDKCWGNGESLDCCLTYEDFQHCFEHWKICMEHCKTKEEGLVLLKDTIWNKNIIFYSVSLYLIATPRITLIIHVTYSSLFTIIITLIKIVFCI